MKIEYHKWWSKHLQQDMEIKVYGEGGKPVVVFPTQEGRFFEFEDFGMVEACEWFIDQDMIQLYAVDSIDAQSWANEELPAEEKAARHEEYDQYIIKEVLPFIREQNKEYEGKYLTTGVGMGGYHASNFFFRHPDLFDTLISLSGFFQLQKFVGDFSNETIYLNSPLYYLPNLNDDWYLDQYRESKIVICVGQGAWEDKMIADARTLQYILNWKDIPCWVDYWGNDVSHDWVWWRRQWPYFLSHLLK